jgi:hypothetical protein
MSKNPVVHFEMPYDNHERVVKFYQNAFGWKMNKLEAEMGNYILATTTETDENQMVKTPGTINGGFSPRSKEYSTPSVVISVDDIKEATKKVREAGGKVLGEPVSIPGIGQYVNFTDTEGNKVSLLQPANM